MKTVYKRVMIMMACMVIFNYAWSQGPSSVNARGQNLPNEGIDKLYDGNSNTKWLDFSSTSWVQYTFSSPQVWNCYKMVSGNDSPERDPKDWNLQGSNDGGATFTILDTKAAQAWTRRNQIITFNFNNSTAYKIYRINITANNGTNLIQLSELTFGTQSQGLIVTSRGDNASNGEGINKLFDGNYNTKWLDFSITSWVNFKYSTGTVWNKYTFVSGDDYPERDPKNWVLKGSNDNGNSWVVLDNQALQFWSSRNQPKDFSFANNNEYTTYRLEITQNNGANNIIQASELTFSATNPVVTPSIGVNLDGVNNYSQSRWFVDIMKHSAEFGEPDAPWNRYSGSFDGNTYYPNQSFGLALGNFDPIKEPFMFGTYKLSFKGSALSIMAVRGSQAIVSNVAYDAGTNTTSADVTLNPHTDNSLYLGFFNPVNMDQISMISPGYSTNNPPLIRKEFATVLRQFDQFRFMDWMMTNFNPIVSWSDRHLPSLPGTVNRNNQSVGVSWEDICKISNELNKDIWINIPLKANDDYIIQGATMLKNNLNPNIKVYVEYSNEIWNPGFSQLIDNKDLSNAEIANGSTLNNDGLTDQWALASRRVVKKSYEISNIFKSVWGANATNDRVRVIVAGQMPYSHSEDLAWFNKTYGTPNTYFWGIANAPYWDAKPLDDNNQGATSTQLLAQLEQNKNALFDNSAMDIASFTSAYYGLELMAYEGGDDTFGSNNIQAKTALNSDSKMKDIVVSYIKRWYQSGGKQLNWFNFGSGGNFNTAYGTWQILGWLPDSAANQKYQGIKQALAMPIPAVTAGMPVPGVNSLSKSLNSPSTYICANPSDVNYQTYLLNVAYTGTYNIMLNMSAVSPLTTITAFINNVNVGNIPLNPSEFGVYINSGKLNMTLPKGLVGLKLVFSNVEYHGGRGCMNFGNFTISSGADGARKEVATLIASDNNPSIIVYPNPTVDKQVFVGLPNESASDITIQTIDGKSVFSKSSLSGTTQLDLLALPQGIYILKVSGLANKVMKLILE